MPELQVKDHTEDRQEDAALQQPQEPDHRPFFTKHPKAKWIIGVVALVLMILGGLWWFYTRGRESTDDAQIEGDVVPVAARVAGWVTSVKVDDNQKVQPGQVLVQLDPRDYQVALEKAQSELADAQAAAAAARSGVPISSTNTSSQLEIARANLDAAQKEVDAAQARQREAEANFTKVSTDLKRYAQLLQKDEVSQQQYDAAVANDQTARATVQAAQAAVSTAVSQVAQAKAQVRQAQTAPQQVGIIRSRAGAAVANVQTKQAAVDQAKLNLDYTTIQAAVNGSVTRKTVQLGQIMQPGQPLMALVPLDDIWVVANFKENQLKGMRVGQQATIHVDAYNKDYKGHVDSISATTGARTSLLPPENATGNFVKVVQRIPVKIVFEKGEDPNHNLRPGMSVEPTVYTK